MSFFHPLITVNLPLLSPSSVGNEIQANQSILRRVGQKEREGFDDLLGTSGICALAAKCQAQIKEKLPSGSSYSSHTRTISPPLPCLSATGPLPLFLQPPPLLLPSSASLPRNRAYLSLRSCKQSNSKLPAIVTHSATVTTEPGEALRIAEEENARRIGREGRRKEENPFCERL